jgi:S1-C subfamily serine protease
MRDEQGDENQQPEHAGSWSAPDDETQPSSSRPGNPSNEDTLTGDYDKPGGSAAAGHGDNAGQQGQNPGQYDQPGGYGPGGYGPGGYGPGGYGPGGYGPGGYGPGGYGPGGYGPGGPGPGGPGPGGPGPGGYEPGGYGAPGGYGPGPGPGPGGYGPGAYGPGGYSGGYGGPGGGYGAPGGYGGGYGQPGGFPSDYLQQPPPRRGRFTGLIAYVAVAAVAAAAGAGVILLVNHLDSSSTPAANSRPQATNPFRGNAHASNPFGSGSNSGSSVSSATERAVYKAVSPGIVIINSDVGYQDSGAAGTGMVISSNGLVVTNNHVIENTTGLTATVVNTGQKFKAVWLGYNKAADVSVIKLEGASGLKTVPLGNSAAVKTGQGVVAMGNANGTGSITTVTGRITGIDQAITATDPGTGTSEHLTDVLRDNADIISGDSGGPLANTSGKVIGMDTAAASGPSYDFGQQSQNEGFAIPINRAMLIARQIAAGRTSTNVHIGSQGFLGVLVPSEKAAAAHSPQQQRQLQIQSEDQSGSQPQKAPPGCLSSNENAGIPSSIASVKSGALILGALCGLPAAASGIGPGDVITSVGGHAVTSPNSLTAVIQPYHARQVVRVTWVTPSGQTVHRNLTLASGPPQ